MTAYTCYDGLTTNVKPLVTKLLGILKVPGGGSTTPAGLAVAFQRLRDLKNSIGPLTGQVSGLVQQLRLQVNLACAPLWVDTNAGFIDPVGLLSGGVVTQ